MYKSRDPEGVGSAHYFIKCIDWEENDQHELTELASIYFVVFLSHIV